jgi:hypothetical protein
MHPLVIIPVLKGLCQRCLLRAFFGLSEGLLRIVQFATHVKTLPCAHRPVGQYVSPPKGGKIARCRRAVIPEAGRRQQPQAGAPSSVSQISGFRSG